MDNTKIVGEKIKSLRETKQISIEQLAERTGLAEAQIERIENNVDIPSLAPLIKIARALGVRLGTFLDDQEEVGAVVTRRQDTSNDTISFSNNAMNARTHMHYQSLSKSKADRHMEPFIIDIEAVGDAGYELSSHEGEEFVYVMEGAIEVCHGKKKYIIEAGDTIYYDSIVPHHLHGYQGQAAKILAVVYTPI
jgi:transcriptional regulator with XRE-family HTH domain